MVVADTFVINAYGAIISWMHVLLVILIIYKIITFFTGTGSLFGKGGTRDTTTPDPTRTTTTTTNPEKKKTDEEREQFEKGMEEPAYLRVQVRDLDDRPLQDAQVEIIPLGYKKSLHFGPRPTNKDGIVPSDGGYLTVPSQYTILIKVKYKLKRDEKYKSQRKKLGVFTARTFKTEDRIMLQKDEDKTHQMQLPIQSEYAEGFEPHIMNVNFEKSQAEGIIRSTTGG